MEESLRAKLMVHFRPGETTRILYGSDPPPFEESDRLIEYLLEAIFSEQRRSQSALARQEQKLLKPQIALDLMWAKLFRLRCGHYVIIPNEQAASFTTCPICAKRWTCSCGEIAWKIAPLSHMCETGEQKEYHEAPFRGFGT